METQLKKNTTGGAKIHEPSIQMLNIQSVIPVTLNCLRRLEGMFKHIQVFLLAVFEHINIFYVQNSPEGTCHLRLQGYHYWGERVGEGGDS